MQINCKCHGVSGSCELKTCWRAIPAFKIVGQILKDKFDAATEVQLELPLDKLNKSEHLQTIKKSAKSAKSNEQKKAHHSKVNVHCFLNNNFFAEIHKIIFNLISN